MGIYEQQIYQNTNTIINQNEDIKDELQGIATSMATEVAILFAIAVSLWANFIHHIFDATYKN